MVLEPWKALVREHYEVHYIILRASKEETLKRAVERSKLDRETNIELVETMWEQFSNLGIYESNVIDTTTYSIQETVSAVQEKKSQVGQRCCLRLFWCNSLIEQMKLGSRLRRRCRRIK